MRVIYADRTNLKSRWIFNFLENKSTLFTIYLTCIEVSGGLVATRLLVEPTSFAINADLCAVCNKRNNGQKSIVLNYYTKTCRNSNTVLEILNYSFIELFSL